MLGELSNGNPTTGNETKIIPVLTVNGNWGGAGVTATFILNPSTAPMCDLHALAPLAPGEALRYPLNGRSHTRCYLDIHNVAWGNTKRRLSGQFSVIEQLSCFLNAPVPSCTLHFCFHFTHVLATCKTWTRITQSVQRLRAGGSEYRIQWVTTFSAPV